MGSQVKITSNVVYVVWTQGEPKATRPLLGSSTSVTEMSVTIPYQKATKSIFYLGERRGRKKGRKERRREKKRERGQECAGRKAGKQRQRE